MSGPRGSEPGQGLPEPVPRWVVATAVAGTVLIALGAFWLSFTALADLARRAGIASGQAWVWPLIVDGIIVVATISVVALSPFGRRATWYPWALLVAGAVVSVSGNAAHAVVAAGNTLPRLLAAAISSVPPLVLLAITHLTVELTSRTHPRTESEPTVDPPVAVASRRERREVAWEQHRAGWSNKEIAEHFGVHPSTVGRWFSDDGPPGDHREAEIVYGIDPRETASEGALSSP
ncbi:MAG: DUF2637 domain-containing protein [Desertimonas sp.]